MFKLIIISTLFPLILLADMLDYFSMATLPSIMANRYGLVGTHTVADTWDELESGTTVYFPSDRNSADPTPIIFFAPGWGSTDHTDYKSLFRFIASHGYTVVYAKDEKKFSSVDMIEDFITTVAHPEIAPFVDTTKIGVIGFSIGGGHVFNILDKLSDVEGWGENGRFIFTIEPWFAFDMNQSDMRTLPSNSNVVFLQFGEGGNNDVSGTDARIPLSEYYLLDSIAENKKDYQIFIDADHNYPTGSRPYSEMQGILKPLDALMEYTFDKTTSRAAQKTALEVGNDDPYAKGSGIQVVLPKDDYHYPCDGYNFTKYDIFHCDINGYPPSSYFTEIATNNTVEQPELLGSIFDAEFNTTLTRLTDRINQEDTPTQNADGDRYSRGNAHPYSKTQAWNSDMTMLRLHYRLYDAKTFQELAITNGTNILSELYYINGALSEMKWSNVTPNIFYGINGSEFWKATIDRNTNTITYDLIHNFNENEYNKFSLGKYEGNIDLDDKYVVFAAQKEGLDHLTAIVYDIHTDTINATKDFPEALWPDEGQVFDWISVSPLGKHILMSSGDKIEQYDINLNFVRTLSENAGHGDLGIDKYNNEVYVQFEFGDRNGIWIYRLNDGYQIRLLPDKYNGGHISCRNYNRRGWCYASTHKEGYRETFAIRLNYNGPDNHLVNRFAQTHTASQESSLVNVSPDGRELLFYSDWGNDELDWVDKDTYHVKKIP